MIYIGLYACMCMLTIYIQHMYVQTLKQARMNATKDCDALHSSHKTQTQSMQQKHIKQVCIYVYACDNSLFLSLSVSLLPLHPSLTLIHNQQLATLATTHKQEINKIHAQHRDGLSTSRSKLCEQYEEKLKQLDITLQQRITVCVCVVMCL